ncbi:MAG: EAL domain-containing protein [Gammaproteobacteria bacterium]|nr:EAL domain-containing protein [Gammaproteobacteria bacterium]MDH3559610.1 EAL domain-containing protein [Gammaproteobacteria bacterium]
MDHTDHTTREKPLILIADDDDATRMLLKQALDNEGYMIIEAEDGIEAVNLYTAHKPDMVILDVMMPGMSGFDACRNMRESDNSAHLPILMLTSLDDINSIDAAFEAGATDFTTKPINWRLIRQRINYALRAYKNDQELQTNQLRLSHALEVASLGHWDWDLKTNELRWSEHINAIFGLKPELNQGSFESFLGRVHPEDRGLVTHAVERALKSTESYSIDHRIIRLDGQERILHEHAEVIQDKLGRPVRMIGMAQDITERIRAEETIRRHVYYNDLTGLPNRRLFNERMQHAHEIANREEQHFAVILLDLDRLKVINDTHGYGTGDFLLKAIGNRLQETVRSQDTVAMLGSDEFAILVEGIENPENINTMCIDLLQAVSRECVINGQGFYITASMGITLYPDDNTSHKNFLQHAESAMYAAKENGGNQFCFYNKDINTRAQQRLQVDMALHEAVKHRELEVYYQPQIDVDSGRIIGMEALTRWNNQKLGAVSPAEFIPAAENNGLIIPMGEWVLRTACEQAAKWHRDGYSDLRMSVNLSPRQFQCKNLPEYIENVLDETGLDPRRLELEITESCTISDHEAGIKILERLKALGIRVSIDDFGTGYSSLSYLHKLPIDAVKIDRAFVTCIGENGENGVIARTIITMAHSLGLSVIAEGIEEPHHLEFLRQEGCNEAQGFLVSRPVNVGEIDQLLELSLKTPVAVVR